MRVENEADVLKLRMESATLQLLEQARHFNAEDWQVFFSLLENPPEPSERMKKASSKYKEIMANHEV